MVWRDASLKSDKDAFDSQTLLQYFVSGQETSRSTPSGSDEPVAWEEVSSKPQRLHARRKPFVQRRGKPFARESTVWEKNLESKRHHHTQVCRTPDSPGGESTPTRKETDKLKFEQRPHATRPKKIEKRQSRGKRLQAPLILDRSLDWLPDMDDACSACGCTRKQCETQDSQIKTRPREQHELRVQEKSSGGPRDARNERVPDVDWKTDRCHVRDLLEPFFLKNSQKQGPKLQRQCSHKHLLLEQGKSHIP